MKFSRNIRIIIVHLVQVFMQFEHSDLKYKCTYAPGGNYKNL